MTPPTPGATGEATPPVPPTPTPGAPSGDAGSGTPAPDIQKAIDAIIARERRDAAAALAARDAEIAALNARLAAPPADAPKPKPDDPAYIEALRAPLVAELTVLKDRETKRADSLKVSEVKAIAREFAVDGAEVDVADALKGSLKLTDAGTLEVVDAEGRPRYGASGPMTPKELVVEHLKGKPYLAKASVRSGLGLGNTPAAADMTASSVDALKRDIAAAEAKRDFATAGVLKGKLLEATRKK